ncbi:MAG: hypothetical protein H7Z41_01105 [Cytophagales bacterium]|nr:hypothetical protein [Armatimonadota bacterium]
MIRQDDMLSHPVTGPRSESSLEDLLRDAAAFEADADVSEGLAHRALVRQITAQQERGRRSSKSARRPRGTVWLGGLSAGTLIGGAVAALALLLVQGGPDAPTPKTVQTRMLQGATRVAPAPEDPVAIVATSETEVARLPMGESPRPVVLQNQSRRAVRTLVQPRQIRFASSRRSESVRRGWSPAKPPILLNSVKPARAASAADEPLVAQWRTETVDETEYQLVTTAYVATPQSGDDKTSGTGGGNDVVITPVQIRIDLEPTNVAMTDSNPSH